MADSFEKIEAGKFYHIYNRGINSCNLLDSEADYKHFLELYEKFINPIAETYAWILLANHFHLLVKIKENVRYKYTMVDIVKASNAKRAEDSVGLALNKWATVPLPDGVNDPSALKGNDAPSALKGSVEEAGKNDAPLTFRGVDDIHSSTLSGTSTQTGFGRQLNSPVSTDRFDDTVRLPNPTKHFSHLFNAYAKYYNTKNNRHGALFERPFKRRLVDSEDYLKQCIIYIHNNPVHHHFVSHPLEYPWSSYLEYLSEDNVLYNECISNYFDDIANFQYCHNKMNRDFEWE